MNCGMFESQALDILKIDLQRLGTLPGDNTYLLSMIRAAKSNLERQGIVENDEEDYLQLVSTEYR